MKVSVVIPVYNHAFELEKCLASLSAQTFKDFEVIVVDDGSKPSLRPRAISAAGSNLDGDCHWPTCVSPRNDVRFIRQPHSGAPTARNRGFRESCGEFVLFSDADIVWKFNALEKMVRELEAHPEASYVYPSFYWGKKLFQAVPFSAEKLRQMNYIHTSALIRREHFPANGFDESLKKFQDWDLWLTMLEQGYTGRAITDVLMTIKPGGQMSTWLPSFVYKISGAQFIFPAVRKYQERGAVIRKKHLRG